MRLDQVKVGMVVQIANIEGGEPILKKVQAMGVRKGRIVKVLSKLGRAILLKFENERLVLTKDIAKYIEVQ